MKLLGQGTWSQTSTWRPRLDELAEALFRHTGNWHAQVVHGAQVIGHHFDDALGAYRVVQVCKVDAEILELAAKACRPLSSDSGQGHQPHNQGPREGRLPLKHVKIVGVEFDEETSQGGSPPLEPENP